MSRIMEVIKAIRNRRAEMNVPPSKKAKVYIESDFKECFLKGSAFICKLASASEVFVGESFNVPSAVTIVTSEAKIYIPMDELIDKEAELKRLKKDLELANKELNLCKSKLGNEGFLSKAPEKVVNGVKLNAEKLEEKISLIESTIKTLI